MNDSAFFAWAVVGVFASVLGVGVSVPSQSHDDHIVGGCAFGFGMGILLLALFALAVAHVKIT